jgi:hypothetical protein
LVVSAEQLCRYLAAAETKMQRIESGSLSKDSLAGLKKRKRSETPPEKIASDDEAKYVEQEERADKRMEDDDPDYE